MKPLRLLFTGIGRRVELIQAFRQAALFLDIDLKVYGADMTGTAPALTFCDYTRKVCGMKQPDYISELATICENDQINLVIPTIDTDLLPLSQNISAFGNTKVLVSASDKIAICRDKNYTAKFFENCGCETPRTFNDCHLYDGTFPCFIKPKDGSSSVNAFKVASKEELETYASHINDYIIQPFIDGTEYTVDIFCDFEGNPIYIVPRIRLQVRAGEVLKTQIVMDDRIIEECKRIVDKFKPVGPITIQLIREKETNRDFFIEINPRFGGGAPLSMRAGARSAEAILKLLINEKLEENSIVNDGAIYSRFDQTVCIHEGEKKQSIKGVIFDLDDTLYNEKQYVKSGFRAISEYLGRSDAESRLWSFFEKKLPAIDMYLEQIGLSEKKAEVLKVYREHKPTLYLNEWVESLMLTLKAKGVYVGIITDGRPSGQRKKIKALDLDKLVEDIIITDELGGEQFRKPCDIAFRIMQRRWKIPFEQMIYVADNVNKDFHAPKQLGMQNLLITNTEGLYKTEIYGLTGTQIDAFFRERLKGI